MHSLGLMNPCSFALVLLLLLLFADAHSENLIEQVVLPVDQPFDDDGDNNNTVTWSLKTIETEIIAAEKTYLMKLRVKSSGDAAEIETLTYAIPDTGSDLIWLNAKGCRGKACHCSIENSKSKTTTTTENQHCIEEPKQLITCDDANCKLLESLNIKKECSSGQKGFCMYDKTYDDGFTTKGKLGTGKFSFRIIDYGDNINSEKPTDFDEDFKFGASTESEGPLEQKSQGIVGLGFGELSLLKQNSRILPKFSYCLPNPNSPKPKSKIKFGEKVATSDKFSTQLLTKDEGGPVCKYRYCVHLATIATISGNDREDHKITVSETDKVMVIDSASTFTYLVNGLFNKFFDKVKHVIGDEHKPKEFKHNYDNCFEESAVSAEKLKKVSFEFGGVGGGSGTTKIELKRDNFFDRYTPPGEGKTSYLCLTVVDGDKEGNNHARRLYEDIARENGNSNMPHLLGNRAQMDFLVAFDLRENKKESKKKVVSFVDMKNCGEEEENLELSSVLSE